MICSESSHRWRYTEQSQSVRQWLPGLGQGELAHLKALCHRRVCDWGNWRLSMDRAFEGMTPSPGPPLVTDRNVGLRHDDCNHWMEPVRLLNSFRHLQSSYQNHIICLKLQLLAPRNMPRNIKTLLGTNHNQSFNTWKSRKQKLSSSLCVMAKFISQFA